MKRMKLKNKPESKKLRSRFFPTYFDGRVLFTLSQNANPTLTLDHL